MTVPIHPFTVPFQVDHIVTPAVKDLSLIRKSWNTKLAEHVRLLATSHSSEVTALIFSAHIAFTHVLDDPVAYDFEEKDVDQYAGAIWVDYLHPTSRMHEIIAAGIADFLESVPSAECSAVQ